MVVPYPGSGNINPALQLALLLRYHSIFITFVVTEHNLRRAQAAATEGAVSSCDDAFRIETILDGLVDADRDQQDYDLDQRRQGIRGGAGRAAGRRGVRSRRRARVPGEQHGDGGGDAHVPEHVQPHRRRRQRHGRQRLPLGALDSRLDRRGEPHAVQDLRRGRRRREAARDGVHQGERRAVRRGPGRHGARAGLRHAREGHHAGPAHVGHPASTHTVTYPCTPSSSSSLCCTAAPA